MPEPLQSLARRRFIEALRNPENAYKQIRGKISDGRGGFCTIGLFYEVNKDIFDRSGQEYSTFKKDSGVSVVKIWWYNDLRCKTFAEIADLVERKLEKKNAL